MLNTSESQPAKIDGSIDTSQFGTTSPAFVGIDINHPPIPALERLASKVLFRPSHDYIPSHKSELLLSARWGQVQVWREYHSSVEQYPAGEPQLFVLRFLGSRGRAERATLDPVDRLPGVSAAVWAVNAPGFGSSTGPSSLTRYADSATLAHTAILKAADGHPVFICGKSLGALAALHTASQLSCHGVILRNAMPLTSLISNRYGWWSGGVATLLANRCVPQELNGLGTAPHCSAPALFLISRGDRLVPPAYQQMLIDAYGGQNESLIVDGGHDERVLNPHDEQRYKDALVRFISCNSRTNSGGE